MSDREIERILGALEMNSLEKAKDFQKRTKEFAIDIIRFFRRLPKTEEARVLGRQILRSGTSVAANYRAACRARSKAEFAAKISIVVEEVDETAFWLELLVESDIVSEEMVRDLTKEANELLAIFVASRKTVRGGNP